MNKLVISLLLFAYCFNTSAQHITTYKGESVYIYPYKIERTNPHDNIPPIVEKLPDGKYIAYYDYEYFYKFSLWKMKKTKRTTDSLVVACEFQLANGRKEGPWTSYSLSGKKIYEGAFRHNLKNGIWRYYVNEKRKSYLSSSTTYENGLKSGPYYYYYRDGKIREHKNYKNNKLFGESIYYYSNGQPYAELIIGDTVIHKESFFNVYRLETILYHAKIPYAIKRSIIADMKSRRYSNETMILNGPATFYHLNGQKSVVLQFVDGIVTNISDVYNSNGEVVLHFEKANPSVGFHETAVTETLKLKENKVISIYTPNFSFARYHIKNNDTIKKEINYHLNYDLNTDTLLLQNVLEQKKNKQRSYYHPASKTTFQYKEKKGKIEYFKDIKYDTVTNTLTYTEVDSSLTNRFTIEEYYTKKNQKSIRTSEIKNPFTSSYALCRLWIDSKPFSGFLNVESTSKKHANATLATSKKTGELIYYSNKIKNGRYAFFNGYLDGEVRLTTGKKNRTLELFTYHKGILHGPYEQYKTIIIPESKKDLAAECGIKGKSHYYRSLITNYHDGKLDGDYVCSDFLGNVLTYKSYVNGKLEDIAVDYNSNSLLTSSVEYKKDFINGELLFVDYERKSHLNKISKRPKYVFSYAKRHVLVANFTNGELNGKIRFFTNSELEVSGQGKKGNCSGEWQYYTPISKFPYFTMVYNDTNATQLVITNYKDHIKLNQGATSYYFNPERNQTNYYSTSTGSKGNGLFTAFYPNGDTCYFGYKKGLSLVGKWHHYAEQNKLIKEMNFYNDTLMLLPGDTLPIIGTIKTFYPNGKLQLEGFMTSFDYFYDCNNMHHIPDPIYLYSNLWDENNVQILKNGSGYVYEKNKQGITIAEGAMKDYKKIGVWKIYNDAGALHEIGNYLDGLKDGTWLVGDLTGLNLDGLNCFDLNHPEINKIIEQHKNTISLSEYIFDKGALVQESSFALNKNEQYLRKISKKRRKRISHYDF